MKRAIIGYHQDEEDDWVSELDCFHHQHVRNTPPFVNRPWVETKKGRDDMLGEVLECVCCDRRELPEGLVAYQSTPDFDEESVPKGLLNDHSTKKGTWGIITIASGELIYTVTEPAIRHFTLVKGDQGIVVPCMIHSVKPHGKVVFKVEFFTKPKTD